MKQPFLKRFEEICKRFDEFYARTRGAKGPYPQMNLTFDDLEGIVTEDKYAEVNIGQSALGYIKSCVKPYPEEIDKDILKSKILKSWPYYDLFFSKLESKGTKLFAAETDFTTQGIAQIVSSVSKSGVDPEKLAEYLTKHFTNMYADARAMDNKKMPKRYSSKLKPSERSSIQKDLVDKVKGLALRFNDSTILLLINSNAMQNEMVILHEFMHVVQYVTEDKIDKLNTSVFVPFSNTDKFTKDKKIATLGVGIICIVADNTNDPQIKYLTNPFELKSNLFVNFFNILQRFYHDKKLLKKYGLRQDISWELFIDRTISDLKHAVDINDPKVPLILQALQEKPLRDDAAGTIINLLTEFFIANKQIGGVVDQFLEYLIKTLKEKKP